MKTLFSVFAVKYFFIKSKNQQGAVALWSNASALDRRSRDQNSPPTFLLNGQPRRAKKEETNLEANEKRGTGAPANNHGRASALGIESLVLILS